MALPSHNDPLRLADGRLVYPGGHVDDPARVRPTQFVEVPTHVDAQRIVTSARRKISDLPELPRTMNAVGAILAYTMFGLDEEETAIATGLTVEQVGRLKVGDAYSQMYEALVHSVLDQETDVVRELLAKNARGAASVMVEALEAGSRADRMAAARDILDRSGHRPVDVVEHRHRMDGGLIIEIVKRDTSNSLPVIDMERDQ